MPKAKPTPETLPEHIARRSDNRKLLVDIKVPSHLRKIVGATNLRRSLGTTELTSETRRKASTIIGEFLTRIADAERQLDRDAADRRAANLRDQRDGYLFSMGIRQDATLPDVLDFAASGWPNPEATELVVEEAVKRLSDTPNNLIIVERYIDITAARLDIARKVLERLKAPPTPKMVAAFESTMTVTTLLDKFLKTNKKTKDTERQYRAAVSLYLENQSDLPITQVTRQHARDYRDYLHSRADLTYGTCDQRLKKLRALFHFGASEIQIPNPFKDIAVDANTKEGHGNELDRSFVPPEILNITLTEILPTFGPNNSFRWPYLVCFFTGARIEEVCGLRMDEVGEHWGVNCIHIRPRKEDNRTIKKVEARYTPIHAFLWNELGFGKFVEDRRKAEKVMLFDFPQWRKKFYSAQFQERMTVMRRPIESARDIDLGDQHALRHNLNTLLMAAGVRDEYRQLILGHAVKGRTNAGYGTKDATLEHLRDALGQIELASYNFSKLT